LREQRANSPFARFGVRVRKWSDVAINKQRATSDWRDDVTIILAANCQSLECASGFEEQPK